MSIGPSETLRAGMDPSDDPGQSLLEMLQGIIKHPQFVSEAAADEAQKKLDLVSGTEDPEAMILLLLEALEKDPNNVDVHLALLEASALEDAYHIPVLEALKAIARHQLGEDLFTHHAGEFWFLSATRPYMRVCQELAQEFHYQQHFEEAAAQWKHMCQLDTRDHQGTRQRLLLVYLAMGKYAEADTLLESCSEAATGCAFSWGQCLQHLLRSDFSMASQALKAARAQNPFMEDFIRGTCQPPPELPAHHVIGSMEEAVMFVDDMLTAWNRHPEAVTWLQEQERAQPESSGA